MLQVISRSYTAEPKENTRRPTRAKMADQGADQDGGSLFCSSSDSGIMACPADGQSSASPGGTGSATFSLGSTPPGATGGENPETPGILDGFVEEPAPIPRPTRAGNKVEEPTAGEPGNRIVMPPPGLEDRDIASNTVRRIDMSSQVPRPTKAPSPNTPRRPLSAPPERHSPPGHTGEQARGSGQDQGDGTGDGRGGQKRPATSQVLTTPPTKKAGGWTTGEGGSSPNEPSGRSRQESGRQTPREKRGPQSEEDGQQMPDAPPSSKKRIASRGPSTVPIEQPSPEATRAEPRGESVETQMSGSWQQVPSLLHSPSRKTPEEEATDEEQLLPLAREAAETTIQMRKTIGELEERQEATLRNSSSESTTIDEMRKSEQRAVERLEASCEERVQEATSSRRIGTTEKNLQLTTRRLKTLQSGGKENTVKPS